MSEYIRRARPSLKTFVELVRCQTAADYRPNKALIPAVLTRRCCGYPRLPDLVRIASEGVRINLRHPLPRQTQFPRSHPSAVERINVLRKNIRKEQDRWRCISVDADIITIWPEIYISPFGVVDKGDGDPLTTGRVIHDLSFPDGESVNDLTDRTDIADPEFEHCSDIAREIVRCKKADPHADVKVMAGDVASPYRNAYTHSASVFACAGHIPEDNAIVVDLSAAFGWTGSAGTYSMLGGAVAFVHDNSYDAARPSGFYNYHWVDDHINVASDVGPRCAATERSLRFAMTAVMGASAVNEDKFTTWSTRQQVLGLLFDTVASTVAMPASKISKAQQRVAEAMNATTITRPTFRSLLGSLRHVATCIRPARVFIQRLRDGERNLHRYSRVQISTTMRDDLAWWWYILHDPALNGVPLEYFGELPEPDITVVTDASDTGVCATVPTHRLALTYRFSVHEQALIRQFKDGQANEFDINYRELLACAFAIKTWGSEWSSTNPHSLPVHVHFRIDNTSAISWQSKMSSRNSRAQLLIRLLGVWAHTFRIRISAPHIPGSENTVADAGSRRWENDTFAQLCRESTRGWQQAPPPSSITDLEHD